MCPTHGSACEWHTLGDLITIVHAAMIDRYGADLAPFCTAVIVDFCLYDTMGVA